VSESRCYQKHKSSITIALSLFSSTKVLVTLLLAAQRSDTMCIYLVCPITLLSVVGYHLLEHTKMSPAKGPRQLQR
jgi:hypothetical protein